MCVCVYVCFGLHTLGEECEELQSVTSETEVPINHYLYTLLSDLLDHPD